METITVGHLIKELSKFDDKTKVEVMMGWSTVIIRTVSGDNEEGAYLEVGE